MTFNWAKASDVDLCSYALHTFQHFKSIPINCAIKCDDVNKLIVVLLSTGK